jgi:hypothetical protein
MAFVANEDSVRERICQALVSLFEGQKKGIPTTDPHLFAWDLVQRQPLGERENRVGDRVLAVLDPLERADPQIATFHKFLSVVLEWSIRLDPDDEEPSECANQVFTSIQRKLREDITLGGLSIQVRETGNEKDIESYKDRIIEGAVFVEILYKHRENDPRERV